MLSFLPFWCVFQSKLCSNFIELIAGMGTKIQCKTYLPTYLNSHVNNRVSLLNHEEQKLRSVQHFDFFASCVPVDGYFEHDKEKVRQTILKHESIFRHQV